jgi:hypothetical protein
MEVIKALFVLVLLGFAVWFGISIFHTMSTISTITDITDNQVTTAPIASVTDNIANNLIATTLPASSTIDNTTLGIAVLLLIVRFITEGISYTGGNTRARHIPDEALILPQGDGNPGARQHIDNQVFTVPHNGGELIVKIVSVEKPTEHTSRIRNRRLKNT